MGAQVRALPARGAEGCGGWLRPTSSPSSTTRARGRDANDDDMSDETKHEKMNDGQPIRCGTCERWRLARERAALEAMARDAAHAERLAAERAEFELSGLER